MKLQALPRAPNFRTWKLATQNEIAGASGDPQAAFTWILKVGKSGVSIDELEDSESFPTLDAKLAAAITRVAQGDLSNRINLMMDRKAKAGKMVTGRQMLFLVYEQYRISEVDGALLGLEDLMHVRLHNDDLRNFLYDWENVLAAIADQPSDDVPETFFKQQLKGSIQLKDQMAYYDRLDFGHADK